MSNVISVVNQKGGCAKTTTAMNLGYSLSKKGFKTLLIDFDPQANLTLSFDLQHDKIKKRSITQYLKETISGNDISIENYIHHLGSNYSCLPCDIELAAIEVNLVQHNQREYILKQALRGLSEQFDYIIIDCMPSLGMLTINALVASTEVIIPVAPNYYSAKGLELLLKTIASVKRRNNRSLYISGILITMLNQRTKISKNIVNLVCESYEESIYIYETRIHHSVKIPEAQFNNKCIQEYKPKHKLALEYGAFCEEYLRRLEG